MSIVLIVANQRRRHAVDADRVQKKDCADFPGICGAPRQVGRRRRQTTSTGLLRARLCKPCCRQGPIFFSGRQVWPVDKTGHSSSDHLRWPLDGALPCALERCCTALETTAPYIAPSFPRAAAPNTPSAAWDTWLLDNALSSNVGLRYAVRVVVRAVDAPRVDHLITNTFAQVQPLQNYRKGTRRQTDVSLLP